jgi:tetratricopeptide (TPR) repeat protein
MNTLETTSPPEVPVPVSGDSRAARPRLAGLLVGLALVLLTACAYGRVWAGDFQFLNADDDQYVTENSHVRTGLSGANLWWALTAFHSANWHPLTWASLQLDAQLFGLNARAFHATNVALHAANAVLLFLVLWRLTGSLWRSAAVAAFFAVHPLHVESVAWVAEHKDVLSGLFFFLTLGAYARNAERPGWGRYLPVVLLFALGLLAKQMLVTLPFVLLLLDYWPLRRWAPGTFGRLVGEKLPLLALAAGVCVLTVRAQAGLIQSTEAVPFGDRLANGVVSYVEYLRATFWPTGLAFFYPLDRAELVWWRVAGACVVLAAVTALALAWRRSRPYVLVGWLWYLGMLVPVIGLVQLAIQARADRYTYLPLVGIFIVLAWGVADLVSGRRARLAVAAGVAGLLGACLVATWVQSGYWHNSVRLWERSLAVTRDNGGAHLGLAIALDKESRAAEAGPHYSRAVELLDNSAAHAGLGTFLFRQGQLEGARQHLARAVELFPRSSMNRYNLGLVLMRQGRLAEARGQLEEVVRQAPEYGGGHYNLGVVLAQLGALEEARAELTRAVLSKPSHVEARYQLGSVLLRLGDLKQAWEQFAAALENDPGHAPARAGQGVILAQVGKAEAAMDYFRQALAADPRNAEAHYLLGASLHNQGKYAEARTHFATAVEADPKHAAARRALGESLLRGGKAEEAHAQLAEAVRLNPRWAEAQAGLGLALERLGKKGDAVAAYRVAARLEGGVARRHSDLALALADAGKTAEAEAEYREASRLDPGWVESARQAAWGMLTRKDPWPGDGFIALRLARQACGGAGRPTAELLDTLAAASAGVGRYEEAVATARKALAVAGIPKDLAQQIRGRLARYERRQPVARE